MLGLLQCKKEVRNGKKKRKEKGRLANATSDVMRKEIGRKYG